MVLPFLLVSGRSLGAVISLPASVCILARSYQHEQIHLTGHVATSALVANVAFMAQALKSSEEKRGSRLSGQLPGASALRCHRGTIVQLASKGGYRDAAGQAGAQILGQGEIVKSVDRAVPPWRSDPADLKTSPCHCISSRLVCRVALYPCDVERDRGYAWCYRECGCSSLRRDVISFIGESEPDIENASWHQIAGGLERIEAGHRSFVVLVLDDQNFVQTLGNRDALVVEWRTKSEDVMSHYVLGRKGSGKTELQCVAGSAGNSEVVLAREVLDLTDALIIFRAFHEHQKVPDAYHLRDITKRNAARAIAHLSPFGLALLWQGWLRETRPQQSYWNVISVGSFRRGESFSYLKAR